MVLASGGAKPTFEQRFLKMTRRALLASKARRVITTKRKRDFWRTIFFGTTRSRFGENLFIHAFVWLHKLNIIELGIEDWRDPSFMSGSLFDTDLSVHTFWSLWLIWLAETRYFSLGEQYYSTAGANWTRMAKELFVRSCYKNGQCSRSCPWI